MFGEGAPALPWDEAGQYTRPRVRLYYCAHAGTVLKEGQLVEALQGKWPSNYVELGTQARSQVCALSLSLRVRVAAVLVQRRMRARACRGMATRSR